MPLKKIEDIHDDGKCHDPEHDIPSLLMLLPGKYEWSCPKCGEVKIFTIPS